MVAVTPAGMVVKFTGLVWKTFQWQRDWTEPPSDDELAMTALVDQLRTVALGTRLRR
jgi:hypothetical protein